MKVSKIPGKNEGYYVSVEIGGRSWDSFFSAPSESIDHAGLSYITDRYPCIRTEKRAAEFKRQYKNLWIEVIPYQLELMQHALGLNYKDKPYRNRFFTQQTDNDWNELVEKGLAVKGTKHPNDDEFIYFWCSKVGVEFITGKKISEEDYEEL